MNMPHCLLSAAPLSAAEWWPIVLPLLAGGAAIFLLLPRPRAYPVVWGAALGLLALVLGGVLLTRSSTVTPETILFWAFSAVGIASGGLLVTQHNPARAALSFALVVLSTCGLFLLLAAPFLMAATIIIYAGAIIVTFLFVIMLAQQVGLSDADDRSREPLLASVTGFVLLGTLLFVLQRYDVRIQEGMHDIDEVTGKAKQLAELNSKDAHSRRRGQAGYGGRPVPESQTPLPRPSLGGSGRAGGQHRGGVVQHRTQGVEHGRVESSSARPGRRRRGRSASSGLAAAAGKAPLSNLSGAPPTVQAEHVRRDQADLPRMPAENSAYLGRALFTDFLLPVELGGSLLLVATVGAIAIAFRRS